MHDERGFDMTYDEMNSFILNYIENNITQAELSCLPGNGDQAKATTLRIH